MQAGVTLFFALITFVKAGLFENKLIDAISGGNLKQVELQLENGANVDYRRGLPLRMAAELGNPDIVQLLLLFGAVPNCQDKEIGCDISALHIARRHNHRDIISMLETANNRQLPLQDKYKAAPFLRAASHLLRFDLQAFLDSTADFAADMTMFEAGRADMMSRLYDRNHFSKVDDFPDILLERLRTIFVLQLLSFEREHNVEKYSSYPKDCFEIRKPYLDSQNDVFILFSACKTIGLGSDDDVDLIMTIPGTRGKRNWLVNFKTSATKHDWLNGHIHSGFFSVLKKLRPSIEKAFSDNRDSLARQGKTLNHIFLNGHSMGGGIAYLLGLDLMRVLPNIYDSPLQPSINIVCIGCPPFISRDFKISVSKFLEDNEDDIHVLNIFQHTDSVSFVGNVRSDEFRKNFGVEYVLAAGDRLLLPTKSVDDTFHHSVYSYESNFNTWAFGSKPKKIADRKEELFILKDS